MAMSSFAQTTDYFGDLKKHHCQFWKESATKVCDDEEDIRGKIVIVTGCNTGIGKQIALQMAKREAVVIMAVRNVVKGQEALDEIKKQIGDQEGVNLELMTMDLADVQSIRSFVATVQSKYDHVDILINNAGLLDATSDVKKTKDGFEQHIGVNHLGSFLLTRLLLPWLQKSSYSRIVCVSSSNLAIAPLDFMNDLMMEKEFKTGENGTEQYNVSKLCNSICMIKMANSEDDLLAGGKIKLLQVCPGLVKTSDFKSDLGAFKKMMTDLFRSTVGLSPHQGCETVVYCAVSKSVVEGEKAGKGEIYRFKRLWIKGNEILQGYLVSPGRETTDKLYRLSEEWVGLK